jgi:hypothetical protein
MEASAKFADIIVREMKRSLVVVHDFIFVRQCSQLFFLIDVEKLLCVVASPAELESVVEVKILSYQEKNFGW